MCLGPLGVHRFYVGKVGTGLLYLCTGGLIIGWIFDFFALLFGWFRDGMGLPLIY
jgi:TM2 domain-containing membrane protein YozV